MKPSISVTSNRTNLNTGAPIYRVVAARIPAVAVSAWDGGAAAALGIGVRFRSGAAAGAAALAEAIVAMSPVNSPPSSMEMVP